MLKIKDNIKLEELEKYGFVPRCEEFINTNGYRKIIGKYLIEISKFPIYYKNLYFYKKKKDGAYYMIKAKKRLIKDLIKNGLIEKVEE